MSHLHRLATIVGTLLVGVSAYLIVSERSSSVRTRGRNQPPVEELASTLKGAWAPYHNR